MGQEKRGIIGSVVVSTKQKVFLNPSPLRERLLLSLTCRR